MVLVWSDEFSVPGVVDASRWNVADNSWNAPKGELQVNTSRLKNVEVIDDEDGRLKIQMWRENPPYQPPVGGGNAMPYSGGRIDTLGKFAFTAGRIECKLRTPQKNANGIGSAFWTRGVTGGWPVGGEIDVMEANDSVPWVSHAVHADNNGVHWSVNKIVTTQPDFRADYRVYAVERSAAKLTYSIDNVVTYELLRSDVPLAAQPELFDTPHYLILSAGVRGAVSGWTNGVDATTTFPNSMYVEYVRVYA